MWCRFLQFCPALTHVRRACLAATTYPRLKIPPKATIANSKSEFNTADEARQARQVQCKEPDGTSSTQPLSRQNVHERCNLGARHRWGIESNLLVEKRQGYQHEHCFSYNWNAMKGYHHLMRLAHFINVRAQHTELPAKLVLKRGVRGLIQFLRDTCKGLWLDPERIRQVLTSPCQIRLI